MAFCGARFCDRDARLRMWCWSGLDLYAVAWHGRDEEWLDLYQTPQDVILAVHIPTCVVHDDFHIVSGKEIGRYCHLHLNISSARSATP